LSSTIDSITTGMGLSANLYEMSRTSGERRAHELDAVVSAANAASVGIPTHI
jgi:hypothetical protein